ncbi:hypothetical protein JET76_22950 [Pseudomonas putida]|nr:hypothetical protein [Pseudomonas putida]MBI6944187.1 hypothetical protein [Pseudomonas putida]MBI6960353.1 hypothetical protein [Pseudomonas putida]
MATAHTRTDRHDRKPLDARPITPAVVPVMIGIAIGVGSVLVGFLAFQH